MIMKEYILTCKDALEAKLLRLLEDRQHYVENSDYYSIQVSETKATILALEIYKNFLHILIGSYRH